MQAPRGNPDTALAGVPVPPPGHISRERVSLRLDELAGSPITVVAAPAGSGKTTAVTDWSARGGSEIIWVTLDSSIRTPDDLWAEIAAALPADPSPQAAGYARIARRLARSNAPTAIVLDDFHTADPVLSDEVVRFARVLARGRIIVCTRRADQLSPRHTVQVPMGHIGAAELAYTADEIAKLPAAVGWDPSTVLDLTGGHPHLVRITLALPTQVRTATELGGALGALYASESAEARAEMLQRIVEAQQPDLIWPYFASTFMGALDGLPESALAVADGAAATLGVLRRSAREEHPSAELIASVDAALASLSPHDIFDALAALALRWSARRHEDGAAQESEIVALMRDLPANSPALSAAHWGLLTVAEMHVLTGNLDAAERLIVTLDTDRDPRRVQRRRIQRAFIHAMRGEINTAACLVGEDTSLEWGARSIMTRAVIALETGDPREAQRLLRSIEVDLPRIQAWPYALTIAARASTAMASVAGLEDVERLLVRHRHRPVSRALCDLLAGASGDLALTVGSPRRARQLVEGHVEADTGRRLAAGRIALITDDTEAISDLRGLLEQPDLWPQQRMQALTLLAVHLHRRGAAPGARDALTRALALVDAHGAPQVLGLVPRAELEAIASEAGLVLPAATGSAPVLADMLTPSPLSRRETQLLRHLATKRTLREIAAAEFVSLSTIKSQVRSIYRKLGVASRREAVEAATRRDLFEPPA